MARGPTVSTTFNAKDKITGPMKKMQKNMKKFALVGGAAIAAAAAVTIKAVNNFANAGDEVAKTARKIGISVEALQELRFAADRSGVSTEQFSLSMQKLNKNVGDLRAGTGSLKTILDKTNPAMADQLMNAEDNEAAFNILVKALSETENQMDKAALAQAAFGRTGQDLLILTENGADGIAKLREEARKYGDIISNEAAAASELYVDSLTNMKSSMKALRNQALVPLMKKIQPFIQLMADWVSANQDVIKQNMKGIFEGIKAAAAVFVNFFSSRVIQVLLGLGAAWLVVTKAIAAYKAIVLFASAVQLAFNAAMAANPIGLVIVGIAALIAIIVLLVQNWDWVKEKFFKAVEFMGKQIKRLWNWFSGLLDNPFFAAAAMIFAPWIAGPALILKHWEPIMEFFSKLGNIVSTGAGAVAGFFGGGGSGDDPRGLVGRNDSQGSSNSSSLAVSFSNSPPGTSFKQKGSAPGITVNTGRRGGL